MANLPPVVLIIGGTGAQGRPVVEALTADGKYAAKVLSRDTSSDDAKKIADLRKAFEGVDYHFANTNGFAIGEKAEIYWGTRLYELARAFGVKHFVYAGLEYASKLGNFDPKYRTGHLDGKGKVVDYISAQPTKPMAWSVLTSCLYMEGLSEVLRPLPDPKDPATMVFAVPLGDSRCPLIYLRDYGRYARWLFDNPDRSNGLELHVATEDIAWKDVAAAYTAVTGKPAVYKDVTLDEYFKLGIFPEPDRKIGQAAAGEDSTLFTFRENFSGFWNTWKAELTKRDYNLLDEILPSRVKSVKEWMELTGYDGKPRSVLKDYRDGASGSKASAA
ncbi:NmrA-like family domain-containing protein 1 [Cyphellophora attinorum]|uniref:NmrA-like family domain-containing protein 1 n=1 Tax=Cyphellophora attinorum TaxID=1664694 RepID=A0A0N0NJD4_9EURO|nr:NmrA-like family domain-containing protein 1 [Phialophora attinorum]KPI36851.1 NmrA-like family domain-containing protein 1 [Phialophora attinorum]